MATESRDLVSVNCDVFEGDGARVDVLRRCGFSFRNHLYNYATCSLQAPIADPPLPYGFVVRNAEGDHEADMLAALHSAAFGSAWMPGEYRRLMRSPAYESERELVVMAPDGRFAAFCIYWLDPVNKTGLLEPVGAHGDFRRMGLTRAVISEDLRRMKGLGTETAIVWHEIGNSASAALFASGGFRAKYAIHQYAK